MIFKNLFRRKGCTILTLVGIAIGMAAIVALGAVAKGLKAGFSALEGTKADLAIEWMVLYRDGQPTEAGRFLRNMLERV